MDQQKINFLQHEFIPLLKHLNGDEKGKWGKMNAQQMVEHVADFFKVSVGKIYYPLITPAEQLPRYKEFLMSDKEFRENTNAPFLSQEPLPVRNSTMQQAIDELQDDANNFFMFYKDDPQKTVLHPAFGELNFEEWVQLHHKHAIHHLKQFALI